MYIKYNEILRMVLCSTKLVLDIYSKANTNKTKLYNYNVLKTGKK